MSLATVGGGLAAFVILLLGVFAGGRRDGRKTARNKSLKDELKRRESYAEIDNTPDVADPYRLL